VGEPQVKRQWLRTFAWTAGAAALALALGAGVRDVLVRSIPGGAVSVRWADDAVDALDSEGRTVWSHRFDQPVSQPVDAEHRFVDLDRHGQSELLLPVRFAEDGPTTGSAARPLVQSDAVYAFSHDGRILWTLVPDLTLTCGDRTFTAPWKLKVLAVSSDQSRIWLAFAHHTWWPGFILEVLPDGEPTIRYLQPGWVQAVTEWATPAGRFLVAGGVMNEYRRASVALIDLNSPPTRAPSEHHTFACGALPQEGVRHLYLLPRLETTVTPQPYDLVDTVRTVGSDLKVSYAYGHAIVRISADLRVAEYAVADVYLGKHRELEAAGKLDHEADQCPFATQDQEIREWTTLSGWQTATVRPPPK
jgi:hypothetical protein